MLLLQPSHKLDSFAGPCSFLTLTSNHHLQHNPDVLKSPLWDPALSSSSLKMTRSYDNAAAIVLCISLPSPLGWQLFRASQEKTGWGHGSSAICLRVWRANLSYPYKATKDATACEGGLAGYYHSPMVSIGSSDFPSPVVTTHCCPSFCLVPVAVMILSKRKHQRGEWGCREWTEIYFTKISTLKR